MEQHLNTATDPNKKKRLQGQIILTFYVMLITGLLDGLVIFVLRATQTDIDGSWLDYLGAFIFLAIRWWLAETARQAYETERRRKFIAAGTLRVEKEFPLNSIIRRWLAALHLQLHPELRFPEK